MSTRRFPRTLQEAFGPHTSNVIHTETRLTLGEKLAAVVGLLALVGAFTLVVLA